MIADPRVCVIDRQDGAGSAALAPRFESLGFQVVSPQRVMDIDPSTQVVFVRAGYWADADALLERLPALRWLHINMVGVDHIVTRRLRESGVLLTNARGVLDEAIAEFVAAGVLLWSKGLLTSVQDTAERQANYREPLGNAELQAVVIGAGSIGSAIAHQLRGLGAGCVDGVRRSLDSAPWPFDRLCSLEDLPQRLSEYNVVVSVLPSTPATVGVIDAALMGGFSQRMVFVNVGRGETADSTALAAAMRTRPESAAVLDVTDPEPLPQEHALFDCRNVVISPHMSGDTRGRHEKFSELFFENLERFKRGEPLSNTVDMAEYARDREVR